MRRRGAGGDGVRSRVFSRVGWASVIAFASCLGLLLVLGGMWEPSSAGASGGVGGVGGAESDAERRGVAVDRRTGRAGSAARAPTPFDPGAQREEMLALLRSIEARLASIDRTLRDAAGNDD